MKRLASRVDVLLEQQSNRISNAPAILPVHGGDVFFQNAMNMQSLMQSDVTPIVQQTAPSKTVQKNSYTTIAMNIAVVIGSGFLSSVPFEIMLREDIGAGFFAAFFYISTP